MRETQPEKSRTDNKSERGVHIVDLYIETRLPATSFAAEQVSTRTKWLIRFVLLALLLHVSLPGTRFRHRSFIITVIRCK